MIYEHRTYQIQAGKTGEFLKIYEADGVGIITRYAKLIGCWTKETGVLNSVVFIWAYDDFAHRTAQRRKLARAKRISGSKRFRASPKKDFFNTIRQERAFRRSQFLTQAV
jgi:NIPSNAP